MTGRTQLLPRHWRRPLAALVLLHAVILIAYWHSAWGMAMIWARSDTYAHGFVVPIISLWLVWRQRAVLAPMVPRPGRLAWLLMAGAAALWLAGDLVAVNAATQLALVTLIVLSVPAVFGWRVARALAFPLGFLFFAVPIGDFLLPRLMDWTADFTVMALRASGIPVYREGLQFIIPSGAWSVVEACSGIRYLIASVTVGCLFAYLSYQSTRKRLVFMVVAILVPLVANWVRAYLIVMLGHLSGNTIATGVDHLVYGWLFFGIVIGVMFLIGARWVDPLPPPPKAVVPGGLEPTGAAPQTAWLALAIAFAVVLAPHGALAVIDLGAQTRPVQVVEPMVAAPWRATAMPPSHWRPAFEQASDTLDMGLTDGRNQPLGLHVSYYRQQDYQRKLVSSESVLVKSQDPVWVRVASGSVHARLQGRTLRVASAVLRQHAPGTVADAQRLLAWRFYWVHGTFTASDYAGKIQGALGRLSGWGDDGAHIVIYTPLSDARESEAEASARLQSYLDSQGDALVVALEQTRGRS
ncbi:exosortase A [Acidovorax sp. JHL-9]|uniref:exosortase A n=1 Tax=Acidovorax sp. JHL-9 TaxID=1276756 RepID=UPI000404D75C|nr:exosortase A [Acidovorax sp. JHL-9]